MGGTVLNSVAQLVEEHIESKKYAEYEELIEQVKKVVSVRIDASDILDLDMIAKELGVTRTRAATELLEASIREAFQRLGLVREYERRYSVDPETRAVTVSDANDRPLLTVNDDALQIGEAR